MLESTVIRCYFSLSKNMECDMTSERELVDAVIKETGLPKEQAQEVVHSVMDSALQEFDGGEPVINFDTGTIDLLIEKETLLRSLVDKANMSVADAQPLLDTILELLIRI